MHCLEPYLAPKLRLGAQGREALLPELDRKLPVLRLGKQSLQDVGAQAELGTQGDPTYTKWLHSLDA
jgi:hypothetical protein